MKTNWTPTEQQELKKKQSMVAADHEDILTGTEGNYNKNG
jgi:hypothetical protein